MNLPHKSAKMAGWQRKGSPSLQLKNEEKIKPLKIYTLGWIKVG